MTAYVDDFKAKYGRMVMCHMIADNSKELHDIADLIGVARRWIQNPGTWREHFDICLTKRKAAVESGAVEIPLRQLAKMLEDRRLAKNKGATT